MKKIITAWLVTLSVFFSGCGQELVVKGKTYPTYGFLNMDKYRSDNVCYDVSIGNVIWSVILIETVIAPVYFVGFSIFNPVRMKNSTTDKCNIDN